ncbi:MAG TPA: PrsW family intramembrane metalloprotease [Actinomycetota bacterium]|nr:PrsW family intramembrane metalloprotease [Actinomycetota bacterium]
MSASLPPPPPFSGLARHRWATRGTLFRFRSPAFWLFAAIVVVTGVLSIEQQQAFRDLSPSGWALSWGLLALYVLPVLLLVSVLDLYEREPLSLLAGAFLWGAVAATTLSAYANEGWGLVVARVGGPGFASRWTAALSAPIVEETLKVAGIVLLAILAADEFDDVLDGFVYGALCGLGFAVVEDVFYFIGVFGGTPGGVLAGFWVRVVSSGLYGHVLYTGLSGMGVAYVVSRRGQEPLGRRVGIALALFLAGLAGHVLWNAPILDLFPGKTDGILDLLRIPLAAAVKGLPLLAFVVVLVRLAHRRERRWLESALRSEVGRRGLTAAELGVLLDPRARRRARREVGARAGPGAARVLRRLQREQVNLAMAGARATSPEDPALVRQRDYCKSLRDALHAIPGAAAAAPGPGPRVPETTSGPTPPAP